MKSIHNHSHYEILYIPEGERVLVAEKSKYKLDKSLEEIGYKMAPTHNTATECRFAYKEETIKLIDSGTAVYDDSTTGITCYYGWILFEQKATGKKSVQISTHFSARSETARSRQALKLNSYIAEIEKAGYTFMASGDFNASHASSPVNTILRVAKSARTQCAKKVHMQYSTVNDFLPAKLGTPIDHCFYSKSGITANYFETVIGYYSYISSDHLPIVLDFALT